MPVIARAPTPRSWPGRSARTCSRGTCWPGVAGNTSRRTSSAAWLQLVAQRVAPARPRRRHRLLLHQRRTVVELTAAAPARRRRCAGLPHDSSSSAPLVDGVAGRARAAGADSTDLCDGPTARSSGRRRRHARRRRRSIRSAYPVSSDLTRRRAASTTVEKRSSVADQLALARRECQSRKRVRALRTRVVLARLGPRRAEVQPVPDRVDVRHQLVHVAGAGRHARRGPPARPGRAPAAPMLASWCARSDPARLVAQEPLGRAGHHRLEHAGRDRHWPVGVSDRAATTG